MRIPLIERVKLKHAFIAAVFLVFFQCLEGTGVAFSCFCGLYVVLSACAFNAAGGLTYPSGTFIFATSLLTALVGLAFKLLLVEPGDSTLAAPVVTIAAYCGGMSVMWFCAVLVRKIRTPGGVLPRIDSDPAMKKAAIGSLILGISIALLTMGGGHEEGSVATAIRQVNYFVPIAIVLGTYYEVRRTKGLRSTNWIVWLGIGFIFASGLIGFSKAGILYPWVTWLVAAIAAGYNFNKKRILLIFFGIVFFEVYLLPFTQTGRNYRNEDGNVLADARTAFGFLQILGGTRRAYLASASDPENGYDDRPHFYNQSHGLLDRLVMLPPDDALISYTEQGNLAGPVPTIVAFTNLIPHFLWKDKPQVGVGNQYGREVGIIGSEDEGTGVSFSPTADAYHQEGWYGVFLILPPIIFLIFVTFDSLGGDLRSSPWAMFLAVGCSHSAPEGTITAQVYSATYGALGLIIVALLARYVFPTFAGILTNSSGSSVFRTLDFRPQPRPTERIVLPPK